MISDLPKYALYLRGMTSQGSAERAAAPAWKMVAGMAARPGSKSRSSPGGPPRETATAGAPCVELETEDRFRRKAVSLRLGVRARCGGQDRRGKLSLLDGPYFPRFRERRSRQVSVIRSRFTSEFSRLRALRPLLCVPDAVIARARRRPRLSHRVCKLRSRN
jgi:hypothetical protein